MVGAPATLAHATKRQVVVGNVQQGVVHGHTTAHRVAQHVVARAGVATEPVERQRARPGVDGVDGVVQFSIGQHRQDGAEDLLAHQAKTGRGIKHQDRVHLALLGHRVCTLHNRGTYLHHPGTLCTGL
ncbi:hypothetical protein FQZ97_1154570 [compost metagenome]